MIYRGLCATIETASRAEAPRSSLRSNGFPVRAWGARCSQAGKVSHPLPNAALFGGSQTEIRDGRNDNSIEPCLEKVVEVLAAHFLGEVDEILG